MKVQEWVNGLIPANIRSAIRTDIEKKSAKSHTKIERTVRNSRKGIIEQLLAGAINPQKDIRLEIQDQ